VIATLKHRRLRTAHQTTPAAGAELLTKHTKDNCNLPRMLGDIDQVVNLHHAASAQEDKRYFSLIHKTCQPHVLLNAEMQPIGF
jgi:hypothetical protein